MAVGAKGAREAQEDDDWESGPDWNEQEFAKSYRTQRYKHQPAKQRPIPGMAYITFAICGSLSAAFFLWSLFSPSASWNPALKRPDAVVRHPSADAMLVHPVISQPRDLAALAFINPGNLEAAAVSRARQAFERHEARIVRTVPVATRQPAQVSPVAVTPAEPLASVAAAEASGAQSGSAGGEVQRPAEAQGARVALQQETLAAGGASTAAVEGANAAGAAASASSSGAQAAAATGVATSEAGAATGVATSQAGAATEVATSQAAAKAAVATSQAGAGSKNLTLQEAVEIVAGPDRTLIVATSTMNYLDFVENLLASASKIGYREKVLVIAEDEGAFEFLHGIIPNQTVKGWEIADTEIKGGASAVDTASRANKAFFNSVLARRPRYLLSILELNVTLLSSDVDNVFLQDPFSYFTGDYDLWLMQDLAGYKKDSVWEPVPAVREVKQNYCTALLYMLPNAANKAMLAQLIQSMDEHSRENKAGVFEQTEWNIVLSTTTAGLAVRVGVLSPFLFPTGCIYFSCRKGLRDLWVQKLPVGKEWNDVVVILQNNWAHSHKEKVDRFKAHGMWYVQ